MDDTLHAKLLDIRENGEIIKEVKFTTSLINPQFDFQEINRDRKKPLNFFTLDRIIHTG
jgi:hypothetical protein